MNKSTKKTILLSSLALTSIALATTAVVYSNGYKNQQSQSNAVVSLANDQQVAQRGITDNSQTTKLQNPDEVYYISKNLADLNVWDSGTNDVNQTNLNYFKTLETNLNNLSGSSTAKTKLLQICNDVNKFIEFKKVEKEMLNNTILQPYWDIIKESVKNDIGAVEWYTKFIYGFIWNFIWN